MAYLTWFSVLVLEKACIFGGIWLVCLTCIFIFFSFPPIFILTATRPASLSITGGGQYPPPIAAVGDTLTGAMPEEESSSSNGTEEYDDSSPTSPTEGKITNKPPLAGGTPKKKKAKSWVLSFWMIFTNYDLLVQVIWQYTRRQTIKTLIVYGLQCTF